MIHITCTGCGLAWDHDTSPRCATCGATDDMRTITEPVIEKARGTQLSIVGVTTAYLCHPCYKRDYLARDYRHIRRREPGRVSTARDADHVGGTLSAAERSSSR